MKFLPISSTFSINKYYFQNFYINIDLQFPTGYTKIFLKEIPKFPKT